MATCGGRASPDDMPSSGSQTAAVRLRVLIVDDHAGFRAVARALLESDGFDVVGDAVDGRSAVLAAARLRPHVVLLDVHLPDVDGFHVAGRLSELPQPPRVVLISSRPLGDLRRRVGASRADGFVAKQELSGAAVEAVLARRSCD